MTTGLKVIEMRKALNDGILREDSYSKLLPMNLSHSLQFRQISMINRIASDYMSYHSRVVNLSSDDPHLSNPRVTINLDLPIE